MCAESFFEFGCLCWCINAIFVAMVGPGTMFREGLGGKITLVICRWQSCPGVPFPFVLDGWSMLVHVRVAKLSVNVALALQIISIVLL